MKGTTTVDTARKVYRINLEGFADATITAKAVDELEKKLQSIDISEWSIVIDCTKLATFKPDILPILVRCYKNIYEKFKKAVLINPEMSIARMQLQRVARECSFTGKFAASEQEMENIIFG